MANKQELSKEQIEAIKDYENNIVTLKDFVTGVRKRVGMYLGYYGSRGFERAFREIFQNAIDQLQNPLSPCNSIWVTFDERKCKITVEDNGMGIPYNNIIRIFASQHTSSNFDQKAFHFTAGLNGAGGKITNAVSSEFIVESYILGEGRRVEFYEGYPWNKGEVSIPNKNNKQGTIVSFIPSFEVLGKIDTKANDILAFMQLLLPITNIGSKMYFKAIFADGKEQTVTLENKDGILSHLIDICPKPMIKPISFEDNTDGYHKCNVVISYDTSENAPNEIALSFCNFCPTDTIQSHHMIGFYAGFKKFFVNYMNKVYLNSINSTGKKKAKPLTIIESDIRTGLRAVVDCACVEPSFSGQAKDILDKEEMIDYMRNTTEAALDAWSKANPQSLQKLCKYFKDIATIRTSVDDKKVKLQNQYNSNSKGLPSKFVPPTKENKEFFICEGDSAGGSMENHRVNETQGIFPIRGMIINCFSNNESKCLANAEVAGILAIIGGGYGKNFDISKVQWDKVIVASDADSAGNFISSLVLRLVLRFCPQLIQAGKFYRAVPPLYYIKNGKNKHYFSNRIELVQFVQKTFSKNNTITTMKNKKLSEKDIEKLLYTNIDYIYELERVANKYCISPDILEIYLDNRKESADVICKKIKEKYRFMEKKNIHGHICCDGIANGVSNTLIIGDRMINECKSVINIINNNLYTSYKVNGVESTILDIMRLYSKSEPSNLMRLKGLGEQAPEELAESVVYPGDLGNRTLIQYTMSSAMKEIEEIRGFETNTARLLEDLVVTRLDITD